MTRTTWKLTTAAASLLMALTACGEAGPNTEDWWTGSDSGPDADDGSETSTFPDVDAGGPSESWPDPEQDAGTVDANGGEDGPIETPDAQTEPLDSGPSHDPLWFNIIVRQTEMACSSCGIWFDWQQEQENKPKLVVEFQHEGSGQANTYQHGLGGMENAFSMYLSAAGDRIKHSMLVKKSLARHGFFRADIGDIPVGATVTKATLHLHIHTHEGLAFSDQSSVLAVHACDKLWSWDHATWSQYDQGASWNESGGDFGAFIREIRAKEDLVDRGFSKANPDAHFDVTAYVAELQATRP
jgi:hypothetical protein